MLLCFETNPTEEGKVTMEYLITDPPSKYSPTSIISSCKLALPFCKYYRQ